MQKLALACVVWLLCLPPVAFAQTADTSTPAYTLGVFPYLPPRRAEAIFAPIAADLAGAVGRVVSFRTSSSFAKFVTNLQQQRYDIALVQPFAYVRSAVPAGYSPLARLAASLTGIVVVQSGSPLRTVTDLKGHTLALPPAPAAVSHLMTVVLRQAGLDSDGDVIRKHFPTHDACMQQVLLGHASACVTNSIPAGLFQAAMQVQFRVLLETPAIPHILFVVHTRIPPKERAMLQHRMVSWAQSAEGQRLLERARFGRFVPASDEEYDIVRRYWKEIETP